MHEFSRRLVLTLPLLACSSLLAQEAERSIPAALEPWRDWATWNDRHADCPSPYNDPQTHLCFWPSRLALDANPDQATWQIDVAIFQETWVPLPGDAEVWPLDVAAGSDAVVVVARDGRPHARLPAGEHTLSGRFRWSEMPQKIAIPQAIGLIALEVDGQQVAMPAWDSSGDLWLRRSAQEQAADNELTVRVHRLLSDGVPLYLHTEIELGVSGKNREETLGTLLPEGWRLATINSPLPVAVDQQGVAKVQVRPGQWTVSAHAYRTYDLEVFRYAEDAEPIVREELIGLRPDPQFRILELEGTAPVDAQQTTFPEKWHDLSVHRWATDASFRLIERQRGMGDQTPAGLAIDRQLWLDQDGRAVTYRDLVRGDAFRQWRLDAAEGQQLGAVRIGGESQLITANPTTDAAGVEIRDRRLALEAVGRSSQVRNLPATGWQADAENLQLTIHFPPGWRVLALFGADRVEGDWLTSWSLLDLFLVLVFAVAVARMWSWPAGLLALLAFGLSYHEPGAPRLSWLFLLVPLALLKVVGPGAARKFLLAWKYVAIALLALVLIPHIAGQVQSALYPQLEPHGVPYQQRGVWPWDGRQLNQAAAQAAVEADPFSGELPQGGFGGGGGGEFFAENFAEGNEVDRALARQAAGATFDYQFGRRAQQQGKVANLAQSPKAVVQTGPATPRWSFNRVLCYWSGPVDQDQRVQPILIPPVAHRLLNAARLILLILLTAWLLGARLPRPRRRSVAAPLLLVGLLLPSTAQAQLPDRQMLETLRERLLEPSDAFPQAAEIPTATLTIEGSRLNLSAEIHAATQVAAPLPGRFPWWSPLSVQVNGEDQAVIRRHDGFLWVRLPEGVHQVEVAGLLPEASQWQWTFLLKPRRVEISAPDWTVAGVKSNGAPEDQIFFVRKAEGGLGQSAYDQRHYNVAAVVDRQFEIGLTWKVHHIVRRVTEPGKPVALRIPLVDGERVLTPSANVEAGHIEVRLGASQLEYRWESELPVTPQLQLTAAESDHFVEQWQLIVSPVWHPTLSGLPPVFEQHAEQIVPVWRPWPGEQATLAFVRPKTIDGDTVTIHQVQHETALGNRLRTSKLQLEVERSLAGDFAIELPDAAEITSVTLSGSAIAVRRDGAALIVPTSPGKQPIAVEWKLPAPLDRAATSDQVILPVESANVSSVLQPPADRWVLWTAGPLRGPAVRYWTIVVVAVLAGIGLGSLPNSPLRRWQWVLLVLGLTQVHLAAALLVVSWLLILGYRGRLDPHSMRAFSFDALQCFLVLLTVIALVILVAAVREGLLGDPKMFIVGNGSSPAYLAWYSPRSDATLPTPMIVSVSIWWYRGLMLLWALWLANAVVKWLRRGWQQFTHGTPWRRLWRKRE